jgi:hypothetical protein
MLNVLCLVQSGGHSQGSLIDFSLVYISDSTSQLPKQAKYTCSKLDSVSGLVHCPSFAREDCSITGP